MAANPRTTYTVEEYLAFERQSDTKHEYFAGEIVAMAGASYEHSLIVMSTGVSLYNQLRGRPCATLPSDQRLRISPIGPLTYPDIMVVCGQPQFTDERPDTVTNPTVIVEVLSPSTESDDRGRKFKHYRTIESLQEYVLIAQDEYRIEHYVRAENGWWRFTEAVGPGASIQLDSIGCTLALADVYERVTLVATEESRQ
jgi:Uma2 family endonuclease